VRELTLRGEAPIATRFGERLSFLYCDELAAVLNRPLATVEALLARHPERLPRPDTDRPLRWRRQTVLEWIQDSERYAALAPKSPVTRGFEILPEMLLLCGPALPYKHSDDTQTRTHRAVRLEAGRTWNEGDWTQESLPSGPLARILLTTIVRQVRERPAMPVDLGDSPIKFLRNCRLIDENLSDCQVMHNRSSSFLVQNLCLQVRSISSCGFRLVAERGDWFTQINSKIVTTYHSRHRDRENFTQWWSRELEIEPDLVPLLWSLPVDPDVDVLCALSHSVLMMDLYVWMLLKSVATASETMVSWDRVINELGTYDKSFRSLKASLPRELPKIAPTIAGAHFSGKRDGVLITPCDGNSSLAPCAADADAIAN
jgi:hypothetical protein